MFTKNETKNCEIQKKDDRRSQGMTEYIIIVGLIALFVIAAVRTYGGNVNSAFAGGTVKVQEASGPKIN